MKVSLDDIMERATRALASMEYLEAESLCLEALGLARRSADWAYYSRILLPLQEVRRQRRIIAAEEGSVRLGAAGFDITPEAALASIRSGCVVLTRPAAPNDALALHQAARQQRRYFEVLFADSAATDDRWTLRSFAGPVVSCEVGAPPAEWRDRTIRPGEIKGAYQPFDWFIDATEKLGDAAIAMVDAQVGPLSEPPADAAAALKRVELLESCLDVAADHEKLHQRLGDAARGLRVLT